MLEQLIVTWLNRVDRDLVALYLDHNITANTATMKRTHSTKHNIRPSLPLVSNDLGIITEGDEDILRRQLLERERENDRVCFPTFGVQCCKSDDDSVAFHADAAPQITTHRAASYRTHTGN